MEEAHLPTIADIQAARKRLAGQAHETPIFTSRSLDERVGASVFLKAENMQRGGAFKFRGAYNIISQLSAAERARGVITYSSGNHGQAVALVSRIFGAPATVVMPDNAPASKRAATAGYDAQVVDYAPAEAEREAIARQLAAERGYVVIPPYDHPHIIAGAGSCGLEFLEQIPTLDAILTPCGGGGLLSGVALAVKETRPACRVIGIEPELADDAARSFRTGVLHTTRNPPTIADGTRTPSLGQLNFALVLRYVDALETVTEEEIKAAVRILFYRLKLVVEPSGALGVAALLSGRLPELRGKRVGVVLSGGNMDGATFCALLPNAG